MAFIDDLKRTIRQGGILTRLIGINVVLWLAFALVGVVLKLFNVESAPWLDFLSLPASLPALLRKPWTLFTYMFMHANFWHLLFNMLWLYWFGQIALYFISARHLRGIYVVGGLAGGLLYILTYNVFPLFADNLNYSLLVGASASVLAIVIATAVKEPDYKIRLFLIGSISLKWLAVFTVVYDALFIASTNAGGHIAHLGGALAGWWFAAALNRGHDITAWVNAVIDFVAGLFHPATYRTRLKVRKPKKAFSPRKKRKEAPDVSNDHAADYDYNTTRKQQSDETNRILEKIKKYGYGGLTAEEKRKLFDASNR